MCEHTFSATGDDIVCIKCGKHFTRDEFIDYIKNKGKPESKESTDTAPAAKPKAPKKST